MDEILTDDQTLELVSGAPEQAEAIEAEEEEEEVDHIEDLVPAPHS